MPDYKRLVKKKNIPRKPGRKELSNKHLWQFTGRMVALLFFGLLLAGLFFAARAVVANADFFSIKQIVVVNQNNKPIPNPQDYFRMDLALGANLFTLNMQRYLDDIRARHPEVRAVSISKEFPHRLRVIIKQREPVGVVLLDEYYLVDNEGYILPGHSGVQDLPKIAGIHPGQVRLYSYSPSLRLKQVLELLKQLRQAGVYPEYKITRIDAYEYSDLVFYLAPDNIEVKMGKDNFGRKALLLGEILAQLKTENTRPKYIDMRFDSPVVKP